MKCSVCGYDNKEDKEVCPNCNSVINKGNKRANFDKYTNQDLLFVCYSDTQGMSPLRNVFKGLASSVVLRCSALFQTVAFIFAAIACNKFLNRIEEYFVTNDVFHIDSPKQYGLLAYAGLWVVILPWLLTVLGIWITIFSAAGKKEYITPVGIGMIRISKYIEMITVMCTLCALMVMAIAEGGLYISTIITLLLIFLLFVGVIFCYNSVFVSIRNITYSILNDEPSENLSRIMYVMCLIFSLLSFALGVVALFSSGDIVIGLAGLSGAVAKGMFAVFIVKYNVAMDWLYRNSWDERY